MSTGLIGKTTNLDREVVGQQIQASREDLWGEIPGKIVAFDAANQTATIQPLYRPRFNGKPIDMPELLEVPVRFPRAGGVLITHPVKKDDVVTLRPMMRNTEKWHTEGTYESTDTRSFNLSDYEAFLDGGESLTQPIGKFNAGEAEFRNEGGDQIIQLGQDRVRALFGRLRFVLRKQGEDMYVQMKVKPSDDPDDSNVALFHITIDVKNSTITASHTIGIGPDPNPQD